MLEQLQYELDRAEPDASYSINGAKPVFQDVWSAFYRRYSEWFEQDPSRKLEAKKLVEKATAKALRSSKTGKYSRCPTCGVKLATLRCVECDIEETARKRREDKRRYKD